MNDRKKREGENGRIEENERRPLAPLRYNHYAIFYHFWRPGRLPFFHTSARERAGRPAEQIRSYGNELLRTNANGHWSARLGWFRIQIFSPFFRRRADVRLRCRRNVMTACRMYVITETRIGNSISYVRNPYLYIVLAGLCVGAQPLKMPICQVLQEAREYVWCLPVRLMHQPVRLSPLSLSERERSAS